MLGGVKIYETFEDAGARVKREEERVNNGHVGYQVDMINENAYLVSEYDLTTRKFIRVLKGD